MIDENFEEAEFVDFANEPTLVAYDAASGKLEIGARAEALSFGRQPVVQEFKQSIGESDALFEGRYQAGKGARSERRWLVRYDRDDEQNRLSTKTIAKTFIQSLLAKLDNIPKQFIVGIPSVRDANWAKLYRAHMTMIFTELGYDAPDFFPEPFAVFQYYRHVEKLIPSSRIPLKVLVVDFGGGTVDSCVIETTNEGNLARGGSTAVPLGLHAFNGAGKEIDRRLLKLGLIREADSRLRQDSVDARLASRPWILLTIEKAKILLSERLQSARLDEQCHAITEELHFPAGTYHPDLALELRLTGDDLKKAIKDLWYEKTGLGASILATVNDAKYRGGEVVLDHFDKVILAGGSSKLPFLKELVKKTLAGQVNVSDKDIVIGEHSEKAVALGIIMEAVAERNKALRTHDAIGPCVFSELYFFTAPRRNEPAIKPKIRRWHTRDVSESAPGVLISGPMEIDDFTLEYVLELPFRPHGSLFYWFSDKAEQSDPEAGRLNVEQDILRLPPKAQGKFKLKLVFDGDRGMISPTFTFGETVLPGAPFFFGGLRLRTDVKSYVGIDFGTSNSYAVKLWASPKTRESRYPIFKISELAGESLRATEILIDSARREKVLTTEKVAEFCKREQTMFVFHSVKIEGSNLDFGETEALLEGSKPAVSKEMLEPINVRDAYEFALDNAEFLRKTPESFMREIHTIVLRDISAGGEYRKEPVSLSGMNFTPPDWTDVEPFMARFADELRMPAIKQSAIQQAAEAHSKFTSIHPFSDGNGRTARLIMNAILIEAGLPALVIAHSDKGRYLDALASSNGGDISELCILLAEGVKAALSQMRVELEGPKDGEISSLAAVEEDTPLDGWVPSQELAEIMRARLERAPLVRKTRYEAWAAAFESLRADFETTCLGFNKIYGAALYTATFSQFDRLPFERYEDLLLRRPASKTWLMGLKVSSDSHAEQFVFWFRHMSPEFNRTCADARKDKILPPAEVTLSISRKVSGTFRALGDEPIRLREISYVNGEWVALICNDGQAYEALTIAIPTASNMFLQDAIAAYL